MVTARPVSEYVSYDREELKMKEIDSPVLTDNPWRWVILPLQFPDIWDKYKYHESLFWTAEDITYADDVPSFSKLDSSIQAGVRRIMATNALSDSSLNVEDPCIRTTTLLECVQSPEARSFFGFQLAMETIYSEVYCQLYEAYTRDHTELDESALKSTNHICAAKRRWIQAIPIETRGIPFDERLLACIVEKTIFAGGNHILLCWAKTQDVLPAMRSGFLKIEKDHSVQANFAADLSIGLTGRIPEQSLKSMLTECVDIEYEFICRILPLEDMKIEKSDVKIYLERVANNILKNLHHTPLYKPSQVQITWLEDGMSHAAPKKAKSIFPSQKRAQEDVFGEDEDF